MRVPAQRWGWFVACWLSGAFGCDGSTTGSDDTLARAGASSAGATGGGGASATAGTAGSAGTAAETVGSAGATAGTAGTAGSAGAAGATAQCANVGCSPPPLCAHGCTVPCGCCSCAEGQVVEVDAVSYLCQGGCLAALATASWARLQIVEEYAAQWVAVPGGSLEISDEDGARSVTLSAADEQALDLIMAEPALEAGMKDGFACIPPPASLSYIMTVELPDGEFVQDVAGCAAVGPPNNPVFRIMGLFRTY